jgi:hypothetical protein
MRRRADKRLAQAVRARADFRCEYCQLPETVSDLPHVLDHIIAHQHGGETTLDNLALCCGRCNLSKGPNLTVAIQTPESLPASFILASIPGTRTSAGKDHSLQVSRRLEEPPYMYWLSTTHSVSGHGGC